MLIYIETRDEGGRNFGDDDIPSEETSATPNTPVLAPGYGGDKIRGSRTINNEVDTDQTIYP